MALLSTLFHNKPTPLVIQKNDIEVWQTGTSTPGKNILITAGIDGDELAGIEAAKNLIEHFKKQPQSSGQITIIPIVNTVGYKAQTSRNPTDNKYPKYIYPGSPFGTASEKLIWWLSQKFVKNSSFWIDLHGGSSNEEIIPYTYFFESANKLVQETTKKLLSTCPTETILLIPPEHWDKPKKIANDGCTYVLNESGYGGKNDTEAIQSHVDFTLTMVETFFSSNHTFSHKKHTIYTHPDEYYAQTDGVWSTVLHAGMQIKKGNTIGSLEKNNKKIKLLANHDGQILTLLTNSRIQKGDMVCCVGY